MSKEDWDKFFELIRKITDPPGRVGHTATPWQEKKKAFLQEVRSRDEDLCVEEFLSWFEGSLER